PPVSCPSPFTLHPSLSSSFHSYRRLARRLEFIARLPSRHFVRIRNRETDKKSEARIVDHAVEVPRVVDLIARLVIAMFLEVFDLLFAPSGRFSFELGAEI